MTDLKYLEHEKIFQFLSGLDSSYELVRAQILLSKELPKLRAVVAMVQWEESRRQLMNSQVLLESETQAFQISNYDPYNYAENWGTIFKIWVVIYFKRLAVSIISDKFVFWFISRDCEIELFCSRFIHKTVNVNRSVVGSFTNTRLNVKLA
jgi:hypothetical protein